MGKKEKIKILLKLLVAAVILFFLAHSILASFDKEEQSLISVEALEAQFQELEKRMIREGSYIYSSGYKFFGQANNFDDGFGGAEFNGNILVGNIAFLSPNSPSELSTSISSFNNGQRSGIITYEVQSGDIPSYIAASFGISTNTLLWANNLSYWSLIRPEQELTILPTTGVLHKIQKGETLVAIVKKYKGDLEETIAYNGLPADGSVGMGQEIIIPDGEKTIYSQPTTQYAYSSSYVGPYAGKSRSFPWGQCTWYVAQKRYVPWSGHAKYWLGNTRAYGFQTGSEPRPGAIMVTNESWYGHVAYVEAVNGDYVTVSEMHGVPYWKRGKWNMRTFNKNDWRIRGYIY